MSIEIELIAEDWMMTAALIGLTRLYKDHPHPPVVTQRGLILTEDHLRSFSQSYVEWVISEFSIVERDVKRMGWAKTQVEQVMSVQPDEPEQVVARTEKVQAAVKSIRTIVVEQLKKVEKYFADMDEYKQLNQLAARLDDLSKDKQAWEKASEVKTAIEDYRRIMSVPVINEKLTLNYTKAVILNVFFGQTSILQPTFNARSTIQHIQQLDKDFSIPALYDLQLYGELCKPAEQADIVDLLRTYSEVYKPFKDWLRKVKKMNSKQEIHTYFQQEVLPCFLIPGIPASQSYEELTFSPLALSKKNAVNFNWNFDKDTPTPISALARLLLFAVPAGLTVYNRRIGTEDFNETKRFFGVILTQSYFGVNVKLNNHYRALRDGGTTFDEAITNILDESHDKAKNLGHSYLFVELHSEYQMKKTLLDYYHMPPYLVTFLSQYGKHIHYIQHNYSKEAFVRALLKGIDPKQVVYELLRLAIQPKMKNPDASEQARQAESSRLAYSAFVATRNRRRLLDAKQKIADPSKGAKSMAHTDAKIYIVYRQGIELRNRMLDIRPREQTEGKTYRAGGQKKLESIAYRLLNAAKAGDKSAFMDTVFRVYMSANTTGARQAGERPKYLEVSNIFLEALQENGIDFDTIATAFIAGLLGNNEKSNPPSLDDNVATNNEDTNETSEEAR